MDDYTWQSFKPELVARIRTPGGLSCAALYALAADGRVGLLVSAALKSAAGWAQAMELHPIACRRYNEALDDALELLDEPPRNPVRLASYVPGRLRA